MSDPIQPPPGYTTEPPTAPGWYRVAGVNRDTRKKYRYKVVQVEKHSEFYLAYWSVSGARWCPLSGIRDWWDSRLVGSASRIPMRDLIGFLVVSALIIAFGVIVLPPIAYCVARRLCVG